MKYAFESRPRGRLFHLWVGACFVAALLLFGVSGSLHPDFPLIYQLTGLALLVAGTYLMVRYVLKTYRYEITESSILSSQGEPLYDLVITEVSGNRRRVVTRVGLRDIEKMRVIPRKRGRDAEKSFVGDISKVFRYTNHPFDPVSCYLLIPEEHSVVVIPYDEAMTRHLEILCPTSKEGE